MKRAGRPVIFIGAGAVATSLGLGLRRGGWSIRGVYSRGGASAKRLGKRLGAVASGRLGTLKDVEHALVVIAVPDDDIPVVAALLSRTVRSLGSAVVVHTSGVLTSDVLASLRRKGAAVASFHPLQTFPKRHSTGRESAGIWFGIEGDRPAVALARKCAAAMSARAIVIPAEQKSVYHAAAVFASNYLVTLLAAVEELGASMGLTRRSVESMFAPLIESTLRNVRRLTPARALTGPIARRDLATVERHLRTLSKKPLRHLLPLYTALGLATARIAFGKNAPHAR